jgi:hypothetical protein
MHMAVFHMPATKGCPHVRAKVVNSVNSFRMVKNCYHFVAGFDGFAGPRWQVA